MHFGGHLRATRCLCTILVYSSFFYFHQVWPFLGFTRIIKLCVLLLVLFALLTTFTHKFHSWVKFAIMLDNNDTFCILVVEDKLDGTNYPLWLYMMHHVLVVKGLWNIIVGIDVCLGSCTKNANIIADEASTSTP